MVSLNISGGFGFGGFGNNEDAERREQDQKINRMRAEFTSSIETLRRDKVTLISERDSLNISIRRYREDSATFKIQIADYESKITSYNEQIKRLDAIQQERNRKLGEIQNKLYETQSNLQLELNDDVEYETKLKEQNNLIANLVGEIESWKLNSQKDSNKVNEIQNLIKQKNEEVVILRQKLESGEKNLVGYEVNTARFDEEISEINESYNTLVEERDQFNYELTIKMTQIRDLENRISTISTRITTIQKTIDENTLQVRSYEDKELELKRLTSEIEVKISNLTKDNEAKEARITLLEEYVVKKEQKIKELLALVEERKNIIKNYQEENKKSNNSLLEFRRSLEEKCIEMQKWHEENVRDDSKISELTVQINNQTQTIKKWEEENDRDDARIAELENEISNRDDRINQLREALDDLKTHFQMVTSKSSTLNVVDEKRDSEINVSVESSIEKYKKFEQEDREKDALLNNLTGTLDVMRSKVNQLLREKYDLKAVIENYQTLIKIENDSYNTTLQRSQDYEEKIKTFAEQASQHSSVFLGVQTRVRDHIENQTQKENEVLHIFEAIDHLLS